MGDIITAQDGSIWACGTVAFFTMTVWAGKALTAPIHPCHPWDQQIAQDASGALWIGAQSGFTDFTRETGLIRQW
jgi:ligand-binding sensor domain-containing protein